MDIVLKSVDTKTLPNGVRLIVLEQEITLDDGSTIRGRHVFPDDTLEWRVAEYGMDPADPDPILEMVLWEPHLPEADQPELLLHDAPDIPTAREYHLKRISDFKGKGANPSHPGPPDPVRGQVVALSRMNPQAIEVKKVMVDEGRKARGKERAMLARMAAEPVNEAARVARLKAVLTRPQGRPAGKGSNSGEGKN